MSLNFSFYPTMPNPAPMTKTMDNTTPKTLEERVIVHAIQYTYLYYAVGALYILAPVLGWLLVFAVIRRHGVHRFLARFSWATYSWIGGMFFMLVALLVAHDQFSLGIPATIKSSIGWAKGWALLAVFIVIGLGDIRLSVLARAICRLGVQTLYLLPLLVVAWKIGVPGHIFVSPLSVVGGPGPEFFAFELYGINPENGKARFRLFAPWAPAIGLVMSIYAVIALHETDKAWKWKGLAGMMLAILMSGSRLGLLALPITLGVVFIMGQLGRSSFYFILSPIALLGGLLWETIMNTIDEFMHTFHSARADSSRVRAALGRMALHRWQTEAYWFGHGSVERGPHLVEYMPIGSHHSWFGLLFVKGLVGMLALAIPLLASFLYLLFTRPINAKHQQILQSARGILILLFLYTFAENLEILAYLFWPGLVVLGMGLKANTI